MDISVVTPSLNYGRFLTDAISSVVEQEGITAEHVIEDGCSDDDTLDVLKGFSNRPVVWVSEPNKGQSDSLNKALARASGNWIAWLNADDFFLPGGLARLLEVGEEEKLDVVYGEAVTVDESGKMRRVLGKHRFRMKILREYGCFISSNSVIFRRSVLGDRPWDTEIKKIMDWDVFMKLASGGARYGFVKYPIGAFREHGAQVTARPDSHFWGEYSLASERYGLPADNVERWKVSRVGRWLHPAYKFRDGAYLRQWRASRLQGSDLRWFRRDVGPDACRRLLRTAYGFSGGDRRPARVIRS